MIFRGIPIDMPDGVQGGRDVSIFAISFFF